MSNFQIPPTVNAYPVNIPGKNFLAKLVEPGLVS